MHPGEPFVVRDISSSRLPMHTTPFRRNEHGDRLQLPSAVLVPTNLNPESMPAGQAAPPQFGWPHKQMISVFPPSASQWGLQYLCFSVGTQLHAGLAHFFGSLI